MSAPGVPRCITNSTLTRSSSSLTPPRRGVYTDTMTDRSSLETWSIADAAETYGIRTWGHGYFDISPEGEVTISLACGDRRKAVSLHRIYHDIKARGLTPPVLLRFSDILDAAITDLNESFQKAIRDAGYQGRYRGVYPIKVNQQQQVIEEVSHFGTKYHHGLEAGSKAELIAALALHARPRGVHHLQRLQGRGVHRPRPATGSRSGCRSSS